MGSSKPGASRASDSPLPPLLRWSGPILAAGYGMGARLHRALSSPRSPPLAALCVGNLSAGGTGKTPAVKYVARGLAARGRKPAVLMRGYKGQSSDEAVEMQAALKSINAPVLLGADRYASAVRARAMNCDTVLLDDGFQHWRLMRDLDIVLVDGSDPFGGERLLPHGRLREMPAALARAGAIIITRADCLNDVELGALEQRIKEYAPDAAIAAARHAPAQLMRGNSAEVLPAASLKGQRVIGACGLGNPSAFRRTLEQLGAEIVDFAAFPDHHVYTDQEMQSLQKQAAKADARIVVTEKDGSKLAHLKEYWVLQVAFEFLKGEERVWERVDAALKSGDARVKNSS